MKTNNIWFLAPVGCALLFFALYAVLSPVPTDGGERATAAFVPPDATPAAEGLVLAADGRIGEASTARSLEEWEGRRNVAEWNEGDAIEWEVDIPEAGDYTVTVGYYPLEGTGQDIELAMTVDGKPAAGGEPLRLTRAWRDEAGPIRQSRGNDLRPRQLEQRMWMRGAVLRPGELEIEPLALDLEKGRRRIRIESVREGAVIADVTLAKRAAPAPYAEYVRSQGVAAAGGEAERAGDVIVKMQAEQAYLKSSSGLYPTMDRASPLTEPYHPVKLRVNTIGGSNWDTPGQWISWQAEVPKDGWYKIGMRYRQNKVKGAFVSRKIAIDGAVPFEELQNVRFPYGLDWAVREPGGGNGKPYLVYLTKGMHEIRMEVTLGELAPSIQAVKDMTAEHQRMYRQIVMITGVRPDPYRDYELEKSIPELLPAFEALSERMKAEAERLESLTGGGNAGTRSLELLARQIDSFIDRPDTIPRRLDSYKTNLTALADWMLTVTSQPLELDYLYLASPGEPKPRAEASALGKAAHELRAFAGSFVENYDTLGNEADGEHSIEVWTGLGRDQAYVVKRLIDEAFTPETGIAVRFNLVENALVPAVMSGEGPDVSLLTNRGDAMNLAFRGALAPLDAFEDFEEVARPYMPSAFVPYRYESRTYAIPDEQEFFMMFVRDDIVSELGIEPPETWEELLDIAPALQNKHLQIGLPYEDLDAYQLLARGTGTLNLFPTLLMQNGSGMYDEAGAATRLDEPEAYRAFKQWTDFYRLYDYPLYKDSFNRFRSGEMPIVIESYKLYNRLVKAAPEIAGTWSMRPIPGVRQPDGAVDRSTAATGKAGIILKDADNVEDAWTFLKWWNRADTQSRFALELENEMGVLGRRSPANLDAFARTNWSRGEQSALLEQWRHVKEIPELPGGYYTSRNIDNAFRSVVFSMENPREALFAWNKQINEELLRKRYEFGVSER
ncbi:extracellular solute-binding protein [Paenibacillus sp.]|uniref:extracellular solute-binding protein n=1 Tax=Paenibacillus sp. TaxID=58172 RepID=UPI002D55FC16|nr:extracellular solute-binding protein [Paenibacillus sp.]HZG85822.1 extracellular solute-binding protein [Paenibacillus sp.]